MSPRFCIECFEIRQVCEFTPTEDEAHAKRCDRCIHDEIHMKRRRGECSTFKLAGE